MNMQLPAPQGVVEVEPRPVVDAAELAWMLGLGAVETFYNKRRALEAAGFPPRLPGLTKWSRPAVLRWIETNGESHLPAEPEAAEPGNGLERRYAR